MSLGTPQLRLAPTQKLCLCYLCSATLVPSCHFPPGEGLCCCCKNKCCASWTTTQEMVSGLARNTPLQRSERWLQKHKDSG